MNWLKQTLFILFKSGHAKIISAILIHSKFTMSLQSMEIYSRIIHCQNAHYNSEIV